MAETNGPLATFDVSSFAAAVDSSRRRLGLSWSDVADEAGLSLSTVTRAVRGGTPSVNTVAALCAWSGLSLELYVRSYEHRPLDVVAEYLWCHLPQHAQALIDVLRAVVEIAETAENRGREEQP